MGNVFRAEQNLRPQEKSYLVNNPHNIVRIISRLITISGPCGGEFAIPENTRAINDMKKRGRRPLYNDHSFRINQRLPAFNPNINGDRNASA